VILAAVYSLRWFRVGFMGEAAQSGELPDLDRRERLLLGTLAAAVVLGGLFPNLLFSSINSGVERLIANTAPLLARMAGL